MTGRSGVAAITPTGLDRLPTPNLNRDTAVVVHQGGRRVVLYYFYLWDLDFGAVFVKICTYFPYPVKIWINGREWATCQANHAGIDFTELSNGFASTTDPAALKQICVKHPGFDAHLISCDRCASRSGGGA